MRKTATLAQSPLFQDPVEELPFLQRIQLSYTRVKAVAELFKLNVSDILNLSPRYWELLTDPILVMDGSIGTLLTIQYNLAIGTLATLAEGRQDIESVISKALDYRILIQFCLTEINHGLNAINIETSATLQSNGEFLLHTPHSGAAKQVTYMSPTCPLGIPSLAIVFAKLIVSGENYGIRAFLIQLHDGSEMAPGITSRLLPPRGTSRPIGHSLTSFNQVRIPPEALLGKLKKPHNIRECFFQNIQRVVGGTLSMGALALSSLKIGCYIATAYSLRREVFDTSTLEIRPISSFSTQYILLLSSIARTLVFSAFSQDAYERFIDPNTSSTQKHFIASVFKTTIFRHAGDILLQLGDRCGAQGLFSAETRGAAITEGHILTLSIRFAIDTLRGKVEVYKAKFPDHLLSKHEQSIVNELKAFVARATHHRSAETERMLLPNCRGVLEAIGHRWAYEAAHSRGISQPIIDLFIASLFELDAAWYAEKAGITRWEQKRLLLERATILYEDLPRLLKLLDVEHYVTAPIVSEERWDQYTLELPCYRNNHKPLDSQMQSEESIQKKEEISTRILRNATSPVNRVPTEILVMIIEFASPEFRTFAWDKPYSNMLFSWVCHHWRTVVLNYPLFWNNIITSHEKDMTHPFVGEVILRSQRVPLDVMLSKSALQIEVLGSNASRVKTLRMAGHDAHIPFSDVISFFPSVENILYDTNIPINLSYQELPHVLALQISIQTLGNITLMPKNFPQLWRLKINTYDLSIPLVPFLGALQGLPNLRVLHLSPSNSLSDLATGGMFSSPLTFHQLEVLFAEYPIPQLIVAPKLVYLDIIGYPVESYPDHFCGFDFSEVSHVSAEMHDPESLHLTGWNQKDDYRIQLPECDSVYHKIPISSSYHNMVSIYFKGNPYPEDTPVSIAPFAAFLQKAKNAVEFSHICLDPSIWTDDQVNSFLNALRGATSIRRLDLRGDSNFEIICHYLSDRTVLPRLKKIIYSGSGDKMLDPLHIPHSLQNLMPVVEGVTMRPRRLKIELTDFPLIEPDTLETLRGLGLRIIQKRVTTESET